LDHSGELESTYQLGEVTAFGLLHGPDLAARRPFADRLVLDN
jgi:hypothetical protein